MGFELSKIFKDDKSAFVKKSNDVFFDFKNKVIDICPEDKFLKLELEKKDVSFWYDPDKINSFFEQNNLKAKYDDIKASKVFYDYMAFCVFPIRLMKCVSDKNSIPNLDNANAKKILDNNLSCSLVLIDFFIDEPVFIKYVLKSDFLSFNNETPNRFDIEEYIDNLVELEKKDKKIIDKINKLNNLFLENVTQEERQELEKQNYIIYGMLNRILGEAKYKEKIFKLVRVVGPGISGIFCAMASMSLLAAALSLIVSLLTIFMIYKNGKLEKKIEILESLTDNLERNVKYLDGRDAQPKLIDSHDNKNKLLD